MLSSPVQIVMFVSRFFQDFSASPRMLPFFRTNLPKLEDHHFRVPGRHRGWRFPASSSHRKWNWILGCPHWGNKHMNRIRLVSSINPAYSFETEREKEGGGGGEKSRQRQKIRRRTFKINKTINWAKGANLKTMCLIWEANTLFFFNWLLGGGPSATLSHLQCSLQQARSPTGIQLQTHTSSRMAPELLSDKSMQRSNHLQAFSKMEVSLGVRGQLVHAITGSHRPQKKHSPRSDFSPELHRWISQFTASHLYVL